MCLHAFFSKFAFNCSTLEIAGKKCTCPSKLSTTIGTSSRFSTGVASSLKYTRIGKPELGKKSQFLNEEYAHLFSPPTTTFSCIDDPSDFTSEKESSSNPNRRVVV